MLFKNIEPQTEYMINITGRKPQSGNRMFEHDASFVTIAHFKIVYNSCISTQNIIRIEEYGNNFNAVSTNEHTAVNRNYLGGKSGLNRVLLEKGGLFISGDCDFNFNDKKCNMFKRVIETQKTEGDKPRIKDALTFCNEKHHTIVNMSLMPQNGGMQLAKGGRWINNDRFDVWLFKVKLFYKMLSDYDREQEKEKIRSTIEFKKLCRRTRNGKRLLEFLLTFSDFEEYVREVYFLTNKNLIDDLIESGELDDRYKYKNDLNNFDHLEKYIELAIRYWELKEEKFKEIYKNVENVEFKNGS